MPIPSMLNHLLVLWIQIMAMTWILASLLQVLCSRLEVVASVGNPQCKSVYVSQLSTEAEYVAVAGAAKEAIWLGKLVTKVGLLQSPVTLMTDSQSRSQSALHLATNQVMNSRVKHIDVRFHFIRHALLDNLVSLVKIDGTYSQSF